MFVLSNDKTCIKCGRSVYILLSFISMKHLQLCAKTGVYYCFRKEPVTSHHSRVLELSLNQKLGLTKKNLEAKKKKKIRRRINHSAH